MISYLVCKNKFTKMIETPFPFVKTRLRLL